MASARNSWDSGFDERGDDCKTFLKDVESKIGIDWTCNETKLSDKAKLLESDGMVEEIICREVFKPRGCAPSPLPSYIYEEYNGQTAVNLKWPFSGGSFLRVREGRGRPELTVDHMDNKFRNQYLFVQETKTVIEHVTNPAMIVSFRFDSYNRSFYVVPKTLPGRCAEKFEFDLVEAGRKDVVQAKLSDKNSMFWFRLIVEPFIHLKSISHPEYCLSFEDKNSIVMRKVMGQVTEPNYHVEILPHVEKRFLKLQRFFRRTLSCF